MKKTTIALAVAIASLSTAAFAAPEKGTFYFGGKVGWSSFYKLSDVSAEPSLTDGLDKSKDRVGGGAFLGYQANPYLGFELGYDWLGNVKYKSDVDGEFAGKLRSQGTTAAMKLSYPITDNFDIYTRLGAFIYNNKLSDTAGIVSKKTDVAPLAALGVQYDINDDFSARLDYQWVNKMKTGSGTNPALGEIKPSNGLLSLGVTYNFANVMKKPEPEVVVPEEEVVVDVKETRFVLSDDVLFDFGKSELKAGGRAQLDELVGKLVDLQPSQGNAVVIGHTDRIGSDAVNKRLSLARATSVMNYLVQKGIPKDAISARGDGSANPVTGTKCNGLKAAQLRSCLGPDRRVEIEITGVSQEAAVQ